MLREGKPVKADVTYMGIYSKAAKDSVEVGKDADFLVFDKDLFTTEKEGFSHNLPEDVYFAEKKVN